LFPDDGAQVRHWGPAHGSRDEQSSWPPRVTRISTHQFLACSVAGCNTLWRDEARRDEHTAAVHARAAAAAAAAAPIVMQHDVLEQALQRKAEEAERDALVSVYV
jgi:hypothetical protein